MTQTLNLNSDHMFFLAAYQGQVHLYLELKIMIKDRFACCRIPRIFVFCVVISISGMINLLSNYGFILLKLLISILIICFSLQHIKDKFWNFVFYKFIFIFGVMNVQNMDEVVYWCAWFSILGFLHLMAQLCKNRFEYVSNSN